MKVNEFMDSIGVHYDVPRIEIDDTVGDAWKEIKKSRYGAVVIFNKDRPEKLLTPIDISPKSPKENRIRHLGNYNELSIVPTVAPNQDIEIVKNQLFTNPLVLVWDEAGCEPVGVITRRDILTNRIYRTSEQRETE